MASIEVKTNLTQLKYSDFTDKVALANGEFGDVYGAKHPMFPKAAIKILSRRFHATEEQRSVLMQEASMLLSIGSEYVIRLLGVVLETQHLCLVFEYAEYGSLDKVLLRCTVPWPLKIRIAYQVALGMLYLHHKKLQHLRLKCRNVLIDKSMDAKISDLYICSAQMETWTVHANTYSGLRPRSVSDEPSSAKVAHIPPESILDMNFMRRPSSDVYAYGIILWQLNTDKYPYSGENDNAIFEAVKQGGRPSLEGIPQETPAILRSLMMNAWKQNQNERPTFEKIAKDLEPEFKANCDEAKVSAFQCQHVLNEFNRSTGLYISAPESDVVPHTNTTRPDGIAPPRISSPTVVKEPEHRVSGPEQARREPTVRFTEPASKPAKATPFIEEEDPVVSSRPLRAEEVLRNDPVLNNQVVEIPAEGSKKLANAEDFYKVAEELGNNWRRFGRHLGFSDGELDCMHATHITSGFPEITYQMLRKWEQKEDGQIYLGYLVSQLKKYNFSYIAAKLDVN